MTISQTTNYPMSPALSDLVTSTLRFEPATVSLISMFNRRPVEHAKQVLLCTGLYQGSVSYQKFIYLLGPDHDMYGIIVKNKDNSNILIRNFDPFFDFEPSKHVLRLWIPCYVDKAKALCKHVVSPTINNQVSYVELVFQ